jgi:hypothetical protein
MGMDRTLCIREKQTGSVQESNLGKNGGLENALGYSERPNTAIAYIAGILDGEGCVQIQKCKLHNREINQTYKLQVRISNTDLRLINYINSIYPAYIYNSSEKRTNRKRQFVWHINGKKAGLFLSETMPYLIVKKQQVVLALDFLKTYEKYYGIFGVPKDVLEYREKLYLECQKCKSLEFDSL